MTPNCATHTGRRKKKGRDGLQVDRETMLHHLEELAQRLGIEVRYESAAGRVGKAVLRGKKIAVIDSALRVGERVAALASLLADEQINDVYLPPAVRKCIEAARPAQPPRPCDHNADSPQADAE